MIPADEKGRMAKEMEKMQRAFAKRMEKSMKDALKGIDKARAVLEKERTGVRKELDAVRATRKTFETAGEKIAQEYFEQRRSGLIEFTQKDQLRQLVRMHLETGKSAADISEWLQVEPGFVEQVAEIVRRVAANRSSGNNQTGIVLPDNPRLVYNTQGRGGTIRFEDQVTAFDLWWEYAKSPALVLIGGIPSEKYWEKATGIPVDRRTDTLRFIGEQLVVEQTSGRGTFTIDDETMTIYSH